MKKKRLKISSKNLSRQIHNSTIDEIAEKLTELEFGGIKLQYPTSIIGTIIGIIERMKETPNDKKINHREFPVP